MASGIAYPKQLGSGSPGTTETTIVTVNANSRGVMGVLITVANPVTAARSFRIYITPSGGTKYYLAYDESIAANTSRSFALPGLAPSDVIGVYGQTVDVNFMVFGLEIS